MIQFDVLNNFNFAGLLKKEFPSNNEEDKSNYDDLLSEDVTEADLGIDEGKLYVISNEAESSHRQFEWNLVNKDYLKQMEEESLKRANEDSKAPSKSVICCLCVLADNTPNMFVTFLYRKRNADELRKARWRPLPQVKLLRLPSKSRTSILKAST